MFRTICCGLLAVALQAMPSVAAPRPDPADHKAQVPPQQHRSALQSYRRLGDNPPRDWREANENVTRIGGWRTYLREAQAPAERASEVKR
jgi:hypothetical protein